ncbi:hypothetical protein Nepgr_026763 [Nepenthes gracilis]|uniref:Terpene synthase metal-binding domain-containing protein n=1 Tax=Nepenthes gracilis TaxID=150966 RepID=A0AAD3T7F1_NEPGR|nr:hypothetical protein Nepgr_026763 [Nepenthes gracilis]
MLPEYMKLIFNNLLNFLSEIEQRTKKQPYIIFHIKKELKRLVRGFLDEAKWSNEEHEPTVEEYMKVAIITVGGIMLPVICFTGMGVLATEEALQWVASLPRIVEAAAIIGRIMDDLAPSKVEELHSPTAVKCYIRQYGVSEMQAKSILKNQVKNAWKDINEEFIKGIGTTIPKPILICILNCARAGYIFGKIGDVLENPDIAKTIMSSLFIDPIIV